ncbi:phage head-binding domain-containing protein [Providencia rettgeri]
MSDIIPNVVVSMPNQQFTLARKFQACSNGKIYIGKIDTDPTIPENQIQVYLENEDGSTIPVAQPLIINQAGFPVYNGNIAKFVTVEGHSMAVYDSYGAQQFYYPNVLKYDPDQFDIRFRAELSGEYGVSNVTGAVYRVNSIDGMKSLPFAPKNGDICITSGYYSIFDGGGAEYAYSASSVSMADGFLVHDCVHGGKWLLIDNRNRLPLQVAGAKVDGVTDDTSAFIAALKSRRKLSISNDSIVLINGSVDLDDFILNQTLCVDIEGSGLKSVIRFSDGNGGFHSSEFFIGLTLRNLRIENAANDKSGVGFMNPRGAEQIIWENITFSGWKISHDIHAWNSSFKNITSRNCEYAGIYSGTSMVMGAFYAHTCDNGHSLGFRYNSSTGEVSVSPQPLSYVTIESLAADHCGLSYIVGACRAVTVMSSGAESPLGDCVIDLSKIPSRRSGQMITFKSFDLYLQSTDSSVTRVVNEPANGAYGSVVFEECVFYSDLNIPLFSGDGNGIIADNIRYNTGATKRLTSSATNGLTVDGFKIGASNVKPSEVGFTLGGYDQLRNVKSLFTLNKPTATTRIVIRVHDSESGVPISAGAICFGCISLYPVNKSSSNTNRDCGEVIFSLSTDYEGGMSGYASQKIGNLAGVSVFNRKTGSVNELVFAINNTSQYMSTIDIFLNAKYGTDTRDFYIEYV